MMQKQCFLSVVLACVLGSAYVYAQPYPHYPQYGHPKIVYPQPDPSQVKKYDLACGPEQYPRYKRNSDDTKESNFIVGGYDAPDEAWPFAAYLRYKKKCSVCGGTIINQEWILTAAHCVKNITHEPENLSVTVGTNLVYLKEKKRIINQVDRMIMHPGFHDVPGQGDIALVHLTKPLQWASNVAPAGLPEPGERLAVGTVVYVIGWGWVHHGRPYSLPLQQVEVQVISNQECSTLQLRFGLRFSHGHTFCVMKEGGSQNACHGDSGGPVLAHRRNRWIVYGVVSGGPEICGFVNAPSININVGNYIGWIKSVVGKL